MSTTSLMRSGFSFTAFWLADRIMFSGPLRRVRILDQDAGAVGERDPARRLGADIGIDVAARERSGHIAELQPDRLDVLDRHALHSEPFEDHSLLRRAG